MSDQKPDLPPVRIVARKEFSEDEIAEAKARGKRRAAMEMAAYNLRAMRGDFDTY